MAHPFFDALPTETKTILRQLHAQEMQTKTGPLFDAAGQLTTDLYVRAEDFAPARLRADPDLPVKEWFAERVRALNDAWLAGRLPRDHSTLVRVWRDLLAKLRQIFAQVRGLDPESDLFTENFRRWLATGAKADVTRTGLAYAQRKQAEFASYVRAMYYHLVQVGAHNFKADAVRDYFRPYDIKSTVEARAKELSKQRGVPVWERAPRGLASRWRSVAVVAGTVVFMAVILLKLIWLQLG